MKPHAVLFDLDGTLIDTAPDFVRVLNAMRQRHGKNTLPADAIRAQVSNGARAMIQLGFGIGETDPEFAALRQEFLDDYLGNLAVDTCLFPGMDILLEQLESHNIPWGIVTNKPSRYALPLLEQLHLAERCAVTVCPDHVTHTKPDPEPIFLACEKIGVKAEHTWYVGDHDRDIEAGNRAGCTTFAVAWGYIGPDEDIQSWQADHITAQPKDLNLKLALNQ